MGMVLCRRVGESISLAARQGVRSPGLRLSLTLAGGGSGGSQGVKQLRKTRMG